MEAMLLLVMTMMMMTMMMMCSCELCVCVKTICSCNSCHKKRRSCSLRTNLHSHSKQYKEILDPGQYQRFFVGHVFLLFQPHAHLSKLNFVRELTSWLNVFRNFALWFFCKLLVEIKALNKRCLIFWKSKVFQQLLRRQLQGGTTSSNSSCNPP